MRPMIQFLKLFSNHPVHDDGPDQVADVERSAARVMEATEQFTRHNDILGNMVKNMIGRDPKKQRTKRVSS